MNYCQLERKCKKLLRRWDQAKDYAYGLGTRVQDQESAVQELLHVRKDVVNQVRNYLTTVASSSLEKSKLNLDKAKNEVASWWGTHGKSMQVNSYQEAQAIKQTKWPDVIVWLIFLLEAGYCFFLMIDVFGEPTLSNYLKAGVVAIIVFIVSLVIKKAMGQLPRFTYYILFILFLVTAGVFIVELAGLRYVESISEYLAQSSSAATTVTTEDFSEYLFSLSLLLTLLFGGTLLSIFIRNPQEEAEAKKVIQVGSLHLRTQQIHDRWHALVSQMEVELKRLETYHEAEVRFVAYNQYYKGLQSWRAWAFNETFRLNSKKEELRKLLHFDKDDSEKMPPIIPVPQRGGE